ncbi:MAG: hypothetical protein DWH79_05685 [Planctomycetota bacterium]|nr:MAG: hypothetical protein DWH79_05685 [Planctomycetota bacterium]
MPRLQAPTSRVIGILFAACWLAVLAVPPVLLLRSRPGWLESLDAPEAQADWEVFRRDMRAQTGREGPVQRKVPRSAEPPLRVWLRDYIGLAIAAWLILGGTLGAFLGVMVSGTLGRHRHPAESGARGLPDQPDQPDQ